MPQPWRAPDFARLFNRLGKVAVQLGPDAELRRLKAEKDASEAARRNRETDKAVKEQQIAAIVAFIGRRFDLEEMNTLAGLLARPARRPGASHHPMGRRRADRAAPALSRLLGLRAPRGADLYAELARLDDRLGAVSGGEVARRLTIPCPGILIRINDVSDMFAYLHFIERGQVWGLDMLSRQLLVACNRRRQEGHDFQSIWREIIEPNPIVAGIPIQSMEDGQPVLDIRLRTGQTLRFGRSDFALI